MTARWSTRLLNLRTRVLYKTNKLKYDTQKTAERIWYGSKNVGNATVQVPFMITTQMKLDLAKAGFPAASIGTLTPAEAHRVLQQNIAFDAYVASPASPAPSTSTATPTAVTVVADVAPEPVDASSSAVALVVEPAETIASESAVSSAVALVPDAPKQEP
ncbi:hypothetical protein SPRG_01227 [Saprolegnia parasitica CBS 223.65]|uniref:Uncharacterized protein n=1 Tax=Saprolegnia parasitica (strain CBS 223.65) TaxID=695850 RepID=A0A067CTB4_SAPPC|nr:hypothetical protein SPRG_01227 [Saprolegnia parasitica CBS 223.65]KDO33949.1 hypothetical protein SPRG_01227 [Saprolegnia parasitica CBS 223.65]|eukprot:XP_012194842.1 hypothetical protein SPRG_01227 [Saprolegnia parasitica CBS 223.65]